MSNTWPRVALEEPSHYGGRNTDGLGYRGYTGFLRQTAFHTKHAGRLIESLVRIFGFFDIIEIDIPKVSFYTWPRAGLYLVVMYRKDRPQGHAEVMCSCTNRESWLKFLGVLAR
jgi:hypothetical protein